MKGEEREPGEGHGWDGNLFTFLGTKLCSVMLYYYCSNYRRGHEAPSVPSRGHGVSQGTPRSGYSRQIMFPAFHLPLEFHRYSRLIECTH